MNSDQVLNLASISAKLKDFVKEIFEISNSNTYNVKSRERFMMFFHFLIPCSYCMSYQCVLNRICQTTSAPAFVSSCDVLCHLPIQPLFTCTKKHFWHQWIRTTHTGSLIFHKYLKIHSSTIIGHSHVHHKQCSLNSIFFINV